MSAGAPAEEAALITGSKLWITLSVISAAIIAILDITIVSVALSDIRASFGTPIEQIAWVSTGYMMANIIIIPLTGWLQRRFGFRRYFGTSILIFTTASALCGLSWNLPSLVVFRALQGLGGGAIMPTSQAILFARYPRHEHGQATAFFALGAITAPLFGPTLGGYLIEWFSWHWIFFINLPIGLISASLVFKHIKEPNFKPSKAPVDWTGLALLSVGMVSLQYVLEEGNREGWWDSITIIVLLATSIITLVTFIVHQLEIKHPLVDFTVFKNRSYFAASGLNFLCGTALFAGNLLFSLYCGSVMHYSALDIGTLFLQGSFMQVILMPLMGKYAQQLNPRYVIAFGVLIMCYSLWLNGHLTASSDRMHMLAPIFVRSIGLAFLFMPLNICALSDMPNEKRGNATGLFALTRELGGSIGTAWMSNNLSVKTAGFTNAMAESINRYHPEAVAQYTMFKMGLGSATGRPDETAIYILKAKVAVQALIRAFNANFLLLTAIFALSLTLVLFLKKPTGLVKVEAGH